jgi:DNA-binding IclR family transcriptional regulator
MPDTEEKAPRGRPRPSDTINRDHQILRLLTADGPATRNEISSRLAVSTSLTYLALTRLRDRKLVKRCLQGDGSSVWSAAVEEPCE